MKRGLLRDLVEGAFRGSAEAVVVRLLEDENLSREDLDRIKKLIAERERGG